MKKRLVVFNWKMNPESESLAVELFGQTFDAARLARNVSVVVAPPFPYLPAIARRWNIKSNEERKEANVHLAAQDVFWEKEGAFTGEVSAAMEKESGVTYVIVGHSERRRHLGETNAMVAKKLLGAFEYGLKPILCIGEESREGGDIPESIGRQLKESIKGVSPILLESLTVAYEPIWAISSNGAGGADSPEDVHKVALYIRKALAETFGEGSAERAEILYGGSVTAKNAASFFERTSGEVGGVLVGAASLSREAVKIIEAIDRLEPSQTRLEPGA